MWKEHLANIDAEFTPTGDPEKDSLLSFLKESRLAYLEGIRGRSEMWYQARELRDMFWHDPVEMAFYKERKMREFYAEQQRGYAERYAKATDPMLSVLE